MDDEAQKQFEAELNWCLEQLHANLESKKLSERQGSIKFVK